MRMRLFIRRFTSIALGGVVCLVLPACSSTSYMGIDTAGTALQTPLSPSQQAAQTERNILMLLAALSGCYKRTAFGFETVSPEEAASFKCAARLAEIQMLNQQLGDLRGPSGTAALGLNRLAAMAQMGNKNAQLELGIRFEEGIGVERDLGKARKLYGKAAASSGGTIWVYQPPVGNGTSGRVVPINTGPKEYGLPAAARRLEALEEKPAPLP